MAEPKGRTMNPNGRTPAQLAAVTIDVLTSRATDAIRYCEAYEGTRRTIVVDGSQYSPSDRALPYGEQLWQDDDAAFCEWRDLVDEFVNSFELDEDSDSDAPDTWSLLWEDGCLLAVLPELED